VIRPTESTDSTPPGLDSPLDPTFLVLDVEGPAPSRDSLAGANVAQLGVDGTWDHSRLDPEALRALLARPDPATLFVVPVRELASGWLFELGLARERWFGLDELAAWLDPGGLGADTRDLAAAGGGDHTRLTELGPDELRLATSRVLSRLLALPETALGGVARAWEETVGLLDSTDPVAAQRLRTLAQLVNHPSCLGGPARLDGRFRSCGETVGGLDLAVASADLGFERGDGVDRPEQALPSHTDTTLPLNPKERELVRHLFAEPRTDRSGVVLEPRPAQAQVAEAVADTLGSGELCLLHAPTGTGKTLAYLVPAMLFAIANGVRVGVATYTRALQRQAHTSDVPIALDLLERAGIEQRPVVSILKGRQNYLCGRSFAAQVGAVSDGAGAAVAFAHLLTFALTSVDGDLDQLPPLSATPFGGVDEAAAERGRLVRASRARSGCCKRRNDRDRCGADVARHRAERSHVVLTNHAFVLARREFCTHLIFDECEHLHEQAHSAFSHVVSTTELEEQLRALREGPPRRRRKSGRSRGNGPLDRLIKLAPMDGAAFRFAQGACNQQEAALDALAGLEEAGRRFLEWREGQLAERAERESHSLLREYVEARVDAELPLLHVGLNTALARLDGALAACAEELDNVPEGGGRRLRQPLERARLELFELSAGVDAWLPMVDGSPDYRPETFYDLEPGARGRGVSLHARVLLPNEFLGRYLFPDLRSAVMLSATTWLGGGFEASSAYLGLDRAEDPAPEEDRDPSVVHRVRAPETFDYGRVLIGTPGDAPPYSDKAAWLDYTARFVLHLCTRTRGRCLVLATNAQDAIRLDEVLAAPLARVGVTCLTQGAGSRSTEQLSAEFRAAEAAVLIGLDTFWFGADFPGESLEYLVIPKLPYGVPDRYHHAQCAVLGSGPQRKRIYMPRALGRFRQGFGRLMRRATDKGCVFLLDGRVHEPRHKSFLRELPLGDGLDEQGGGTQMVRGSTDRVLRAAFDHMGTEAWDLDAPFTDTLL
jgi:Rad3-related DNA helicase